MQLASGSPDHATGHAIVTVAKQGKLRMPHSTRHASKASATSADCCTWPAFCHEAAACSVWGGL